MRTYELLLVIRTSVTEANRKKLLETVKSWLKDTKIVSEDEWGQKAFAYPIKKEQSGFYHLMNLEALAGVPNDVEKRILGNDGILRHILIRKK